MPKHKSSNIAFTVVFIFFYFFSISLTSLTGALLSQVHVLRTKERHCVSASIDMISLWEMPVRAYISIENALPPITALPVGHPQKKRQNARLRTFEISGIFPREDFEKAIIEIGSFSK
jgi:hypothetical protein